MMMTWIALCYHCYQCYQKPAVSGDSAWCRRTVRGACLTASPWHLRSVLASTKSTVAQSGPSDGPGTIDP